MRDISKIDRNFEVKTTLDIDGIQLHNVLDEPFSIYGVFYEDGLFRRLPEKVAKSVSDGVYALHAHTAGGRIKFVTDSKYITIKAVMPAVSKASHQTLVGSCGFDLFVGKQEVFYKAFVPPFDLTDSYETYVRFDTAEEREITIHMPLFSEVSDLYIGIQEGSVLKKSSGYKKRKPIVYYGSSITQGGCAARPGNTYQSIIARTLHMDYINLGFSGNALAEDEIAQYISQLDMSVFVYDYDHNAPTLQHLKNTHQKLFLTVREKHPDLPIVIMSRPKYLLTDSEKQHLEVIKKTYADALAAGDRNVYFIDGPTLMQYAKNDGTIDGCHPNDLGFYSMAKVLTKQLKKLL